MLRKGGRGKRRRVWRLVFSSAQHLRLVIYSLQLSQQANYVEKIATASGKSHFVAHNSHRGEVYMMQKMPETVNLCNFIFSNRHVS